MKQITEFFLEGESPTLIVSHTKVSKLYFYKCVHIILFLSLSTCFTHQFHSYTKILTLILVIPTLNSPHSRTPIPRIPTLIPHIPTPVPRIPTLIPRIPIFLLIPSPIPNSGFYRQFLFFMISKSLFNQNKFVFNKIYFHYITFFFMISNIFIKLKFSYHMYFFYSSKIYFHYLNFSFNIFLVTISGLPFIFTKVRILLPVCKLNSSKRM